MKFLALVCTAAFLCLPIMGQKKKKPVERPTQFEIGVLTFFDFGPPFDYYSLYVVRSSEHGSHVERLLLTPPADRCFAPAKLEKSTTLISETPDELLGAKNPCEIPEKELKRELKRCRHCLTFSGARVTMQVNCGGETRLIRADILDRDVFDPAIKTPQNTNWTMGLLNKLEKAAGPGVMDKPTFSEIGEKTTTPSLFGQEESEALKELAEGRFNGLFPAASPKVSDLFQQTQTAPVAHPTVTIKEIKPRAPENPILPKYPPIALMTHGGDDHRYLQRS